MLSYILTKEGMIDMSENTRSSELDRPTFAALANPVKHFLMDQIGMNELDAGMLAASIVEAQSRVIASKVEEAKIEWLDEQILHLLTDIYPEDVFTPPTKEDFDRINDFDANLHTRLHCDGIRHGLQVLRREVRGLSARDDLKALQPKEGRNGK